MYIHRMAKSKIRHTVTEVHGKFRQLLPPYEKYHSAGPYRRKEGRRYRMYINILNTADDGFFGILYARYLLEVKLGRRLHDGCEVDHIDGCRWNDRIDNLQELTEHDNAKKGGCKLLEEYYYACNRVLIKCPECGTWFSRTKANAASKPILFCSASCSGRYNSKRKPIVPLDIKPYPIPDISSLPEPYYEPFEKYSTEYVRPKSVSFCKRCGKQLPPDCAVNCPECVAKNAADREAKNAKCKEQVEISVKTLYQQEGKVVMLRLAKQFNLSDRGTGKMIERLFNKPHKEAIKEICSKL